MAKKKGKPQKGGKVSQMMEVMNGWLKNGRK